MRSPKEQIGKEGCHHFESKKLIVDYIKEKGVYIEVNGYHDFFQNVSIGIASDDVVTCNAMWW